MDIDDKVVRPPDRIQRRTVGAKCCLGLIILIGVLFAAAFLNMWYFLYTVSQAPHKHLYASEAVNGTRQAGFQPLIGADTRFDVGLTIWARKEDKDKKLPSSDELKAHLETKGGVLTRTNEVELFSDIVVRDYTLGSKHQEVTIPYTLLTHGLTFNRTMAVCDVRVAIALIPRDPSFLADVRNVSSVWEKVGIPMLGQGLIDSGRVGEAGSIERLAIETIALNVPLIEHGVIKPNRTLLAAKLESGALAEDDDEVAEAERERIVPFLSTRANVYIAPETRMMDFIKFNQVHSRLKRRMTKPDNGYETILLRLTNGGGLANYLEQAHRTARFDLALGHEAADGAYPPYLGYFMGRKHSRMLLNGTDSTNSQQNKIETQLTLSFGPMNPMRADIVAQLQLQTDKSHKDSDLDHSKGGPQEAQMMESLFLGILAGRTPEGTRPWSVAFYWVTSGLLSMVGVLEVAYWYTRGTSTGISSMGVWWCISHPIVKQIASSLVGNLMNETRQFNLFDTTINTLFALVFPVLQLRVVFPYTMRKESGRWRLRRWVFTHRERASARKDVTWALAGKVFVVLFALLQVANRYELELVSPASYKRAMGIVDFPDLDSWFKEFSAASLDIATAVQSTGMVVQLILNRRCNTFAGNYAILAHAHLALCVSRIFTHDYFLGTDYLFEGLHSTHVIDFVIAAAASYQAATLPRVEQVAVDEQEE